MMDDSIFGFIGVLVLFCGLYGIYAYVKMKKEVRSTKRSFWEKAMWNISAKTGRDF